MKLKNYFLLGGIALLAVACSSNDDDNNQEMTLKRVEIYYPSKAGYENPAPPYEHMASKEVLYYENGEIVLDSAYNYNGNSFRIYRKSIENTGNLIVKKYYDDSEAITFTATYQYDDSGKLIKINNEYSNSTIANNSHEYSYSQDGNITHLYKSNEFIYTQAIYTTNETGKISGLINDSQNGPYTTTFTFEDGDLTQITNNFNNTNNYSLSYYDVVKPSNLQMTITQFNNTILENGIEKIGEYSKRYINSNDTFDTYESSFNGSGYITHSIYTDLTGGASGPPEKHETFYYYN